MTDIIATIRRLRAEGMTNPAIAEAEGMTHGQVTYRWHQVRTEREIYA